jgi:hypothetical protein
MGLGETTLEGMKLEEMTDKGETTVMTVDITIVTVKGSTTTNEAGVGAPEAGAAALFETAREKESESGSPLIEKGSGITTATCIADNSPAILRL